MKPVSQEKSHCMKHACTYPRIEGSCPYCRLEATQAYAKHERDLGAEQAMLSAAPAIPSQDAVDAKRQIYKRGFIDGLTAYAWYKDGVQYVGTTGRTTKEAIAQVENTWNYSPDAAMRKEET